MNGAPQPARGSYASFSIVIRRAPGKVVVTVDGLVDAHNSGQLRYILSDLIDHQGNRNLVIDLRSMTVGDGADLELFLQAANAARRGGGQVTLHPPARPTPGEFGQVTLARSEA